jgi:channel protein (hemolysin III family)
VGSLTPIPGFADPVSSLSHLLGAGVFAVLAVILLRRGRGDLLRIVGLAIFSFGAVFLLSISGVYHLLGPSGTPRLILQRLDHAAIFGLIACSFTPLHLVLFRGWGRWGVLALIWGIAITGITLKSVYFESIPPRVGTALYLGMGWIGLGSWLALLRRYGFAFVRPVMWSGFAYTVGAVMDTLKWPTLATGVVRAHEVFHVAVLIGLAFHWAFVYHVADRPATGPLPSRDAGVSSPNQCCTPRTKT